MNIYILLDRSGSMSAHWSETIGSINGYVETLDKKTKVLVAAFDNISHNVIRESSVAYWESIDPKEITPRGGTPLYDSAARMMWRILDDKPEKAVFVVMTDGAENSSRHFQQNDIKAIISQLDAKKYETIFLGANFDKVSDVATTLGKDAGKYANMTTGNMRGFMSSSLSAATSRYDSGDDLTFSDAERAVGTGGK